MLSVTKRIAELVESRELPATISEIFGNHFDESTGEFNLQENVVLDFKEDTPIDSDDNYIAGIVKLMMSLYNTYGGIIVFGVKNRSFTASGITASLNIEHYNDLIKDYFGVREEIIKRDYTIYTDEGAVKLCVALIPKRLTPNPVRLQREFRGMQPGLTPFRERHQTLTAGSANLPFLFGARDLLSSLEERNQVARITSSIPPSPATMTEFVARHEQTYLLWEWFVRERSPRIYLCGTGGSGKSTLAYEFCKSILENCTDVRMPEGRQCDYVIYVSAKETEFNVQSGKEQKFDSQDFTSAEDLYARVLAGTGLFTHEEAESLTVERRLSEIEDIFSNYNGLIVIDDIDALIRAGVDTGEEDLFYLATKCASITKIIYTLRDIPSYAKKNSLPVTGLREADEFPRFVDLCCREFGVPPPEANIEADIKMKSSMLPLLIETIVGLRKSSSDYGRALRDFDLRGGESARKYLYQREYDRISSARKGKQILAVMSEYDAPIGFDQITTITNISSEQCRDSLQDVMHIFLKTSQNTEGETLYTLQPAAAAFLRKVSQTLNYYEVIKRSVDGFRTSTKRMPPNEAVIVQRLTQLERASDYNEMLRIVNGIGSNDPIHVNPSFRHLHGNALSKAPSGDSARARELYRSAFDYGYADPDMMRSWYHLEFNSGYRYEHAADVCRRFLEVKIRDNLRSEFTSKLASSLLREAKRTHGSSPERSRALFAESIGAYAAAYTISRKADKSDPAKTLDWLERAVYDASNYLREDYAAVFPVIYSTSYGEIEIDERSLSIILAPALQAARSRNKSVLHKVRGRLRSVADSLRPSKAIARGSHHLLKDAFTRIEKDLELQLMSLSKN